jgi:hypothetical protein
MKQFLLIIFLIISADFHQLFSQFTGAELYNNWRTLALRDANFMMNYELIQGSPYYSKDFVNSIVYLRNGQYAKVPVRYDIFQDEVEFMQENKIQWLNKKEVRNLIHGSDMIIVSMENEDTSKLGYFFLLGTGSYSLYVKKRIGYYPSVAPQGYAKGTPERFEPERDEFYLKAKGLPAKKFNSKRSLLAILSNNGEAQAFIKKEKIQTDNIEDLKKLLTFLNSK